MLATQDEDPELAKRDDDRGSNYPVGFLMGLLAGRAIGATLGVLLAPNFGTETRQDVYRAAEQGADAFRKASATGFRKSEPEGGAALS
jgi:hypothetical protein